MFKNAISRKPAPNFADGITTSNLGRPDYTLMLKQHEAYVATLRSLGLEVEVLEPLSQYPDAHFVEDVAVVTPEIAVITRPGAETRRGETTSMEPVLARHCTLARIEAPGTLEGGDILMVEKHFFIGISERTNQAGAAQLGDILSRHGYTWTPVPVEKGFHLKSGVTYLGRNMLIITAQLQQRVEFAGYPRIVVPEEEEYAANILWINDTLLAPAGFPYTRRLLLEAGFKLLELDNSEARKMDGALTCLSLRF